MLSVRVLSRISEELRIICRDLPDRNKFLPSTQRGLTRPEHVRLQHARLDR